MRCKLNQNSVGQWKQVQDHKTKTFIPVYLIINAINVCTYVSLDLAVWNRRIDEGDIVSHLLTRHKYLVLVKWSLSAIYQHTDVGSHISFLQFNIAWLKDELSMQIALTRVVNNNLYKTEIPVKKFGRSEKGSSGFISSGK